MAEIDIIIAGRPYKVACRDGEEETLKSAARLVDAKSREALAGLGTLSEARQLLFAGLLLADQLIDQKPEAAASAASAPPAPADPELAARAERLAERLESLAQTLEGEAPNT
jgi:cell division protein ZapA